MFNQHIAYLRSVYERALSGEELGLSESGDAQTKTNAAIEAVLIHSGGEDHYFADDRHIPFQSFGHFQHWLPVNRPDQFVYFCPGQQPIYFQVVPNDYWYEQSVESESWWLDEFKLVRLGQVSDLHKHLPNTAMAYLGAQPRLAESLGISSELINPGSLCANLDYHRAFKTDYELEQLREANRLALRGHAAAKQSFLDGGNEYDIHLAFLAATQILEDESPYTNIVALDEKAAILHYQHKRRAPAKDSQVLLIDAGCRINGYGSDITRTSTKESAHPVFRSILDAMVEMEQSLVAQVRPGMAYVQLHESALRGVAEILVQHDICKQSVDELLSQQLPQLFMPHGVGHLLGIQVHDVGGHQQDIAGKILPAPEHSPALRNTRVMEENMVFTVEPGFYFIPILLKPERNQSRGQLMNWQLIDELYPCGGIRVEDNVAVTASGVENLTRQFE